MFTAKRTFPFVPMHAPLIFIETLLLVGAVAGAAPPPTPTQVAPADQAILPDAQVTFSWEASAGASTYQMQISESQDFSAGIINWTTPGTSAKLGTAQDVWMYWHVRAGNGGEWSDYSPTRSYRIATGQPGSPPSPPVLLSPTDGAIVYGGDIEFTWQPSAGAVDYRIQVGMDSSFSNPFDSVLGDVTSVALTGFPQDNSFVYWRMKAGDDTNWSEWTTTRSFQSAAPLPECGQTGKAAYATCAFVIWGIGRRSRRSRNAHKPT